MIAKPEWRQALHESNAIGWIALILLVIAIGIASIVFGPVELPPAKHVGISQTAK